MNSKAKAYTDRSPTLGPVRAGQLVALAQPYTDQLKCLVRLSHKTMAGQQLQISQPDGTLITISVTPLLQDVISIGKGPAILIAVEDPLLRQETFQRNLITTYGMTVSEARGRTTPSWMENAGRDLLRKLHVTPEYFEDAPEPDLPQDRYEASG